MKIDPIYICKKSSEWHDPVLKAFSGRKYRFETVSAYGCST